MISGADASIIGARSDYRTNALLFTLFKGGWYVYGNGEGELSVDFTNNTKYDVIIDNNKIDYKLASSDTYSNATTRSAVTFQTDYNLYMFAENFRGSVSTCSRMRLYYVQIYESGSLIRDLIPCIRTADKKVCLYDKVGGKFYTNLGTGDFIAGGVI